MDPAYPVLVQLLVQLREAQGLSQRQVSARLRKAPNYCFKTERLQRKLDVMEFARYVEALDQDPSQATADLIGATLLTEREGRL